MVNALVCLLHLFIAKGLVATAMTTISKPRVMCFGLSAVDFVATVDHFPVPDEKMRSSSLIIEGGGNAANTACAMGRLSRFVDVTLVTGVGEDANANIIVESLERYNVVDIVADRFPGNSPFSYILNTNVEGESTRTIIHQPASGEISIEFVENIALDGILAVHFDGRYPKAALALAKRCRDLGIPYSVDVERPREGLLELLQGASIVICNSNYCNTILGHPPVENKADIDYQESTNRLKTVMQNQAPNAVIAVVTLGSKGSCLITLKKQMTGYENCILDSDDANSPVVSLQSNSLCCSAFQNVEVVDSTGAGDAFIGGFLTTLWAHTYWSHRTRNEDSNVIPPTDPNVLACALRVASRVAAKKIEQHGARRGLPYDDDEIISSSLASLQSNYAVD